MSGKKLKYITNELPLFPLGLLAFLTIFLCHMHIHLSKDVSFDSGSTKNGESIFIWTYRNPNLDGYMMKASVALTSPLLSCTSTILLVIGVREMNPYNFLPWLILTFRGLITIQIANLAALFREFSLEFNGFEEMYSTIWGWKSIGFSSIILVFIVAECYCFYEIFEIFRFHWKLRPYYVMTIDKEKRVRIEYDKVEIDKCDALS